MSDPIFDLYKNSRDLLARYENDKFKDEDDEQEPSFLLETVEAWKNNIEKLEELYPEYVYRYNRNKTVQNSFTPEQQDFICYTIGDWYLKWKENMATGEGRCHRLGIAKEDLKSMICGD